MDANTHNRVAILYKGFMSDMSVPSSVIFNDSNAGELEQLKVIAGTVFSDSRAASFFQDFNDASWSPIHLTFMGAAKVENDYWWDTDRGSVSLASGRVEAKYVNQPALSVSINYKTDSFVSLSNDDQVQITNGSREDIGIEATLTHELAHILTINALSLTNSVFDKQYSEQIALFSENAVWRVNHGLSERMGHVIESEGTGLNQLGYLHADDSFVFSAVDQVGSAQKAAQFRSEDGMALEAAIWDGSYTLRTYHIGNSFDGVSVRNYVTSERFFGGNSLFDASGVDGRTESLIGSSIVYDGVDAARRAGSIHNSTRQLILDVRTELAPEGVVWEGVFSDKTKAIFVAAESFMAGSGENHYVGAGPTDLAGGKLGKFYITAYDHSSYILGGGGYIGGGLTSEIPFFNDERIKYEDVVDVLTGSALGDVIASGGGHKVGQYNVLNGMGGDDLLIGREFSDHMFGGDQDDIMIGMGGADYYDGGSGTDIVDYSWSLDKNIAIDMTLSVAGTDGAAVGDRYVNVEVIVGTNSADLFRGSGGIAFLGMGGNDEIWVADGDSAFGGDGADTIHITSLNPGKIDGGSGDFVDTVTFAGVDSMVRYETGTNVAYITGGSSDGIDLSTFEAVDLSETLYTIVGTSQDDTLFGYTHDNSYHGYIHGGAGNDILVGGFGDYLLGDDGDDYIHAFAGDLGFGGAGKDTMFAYDKDVEIRGGEDADTLYGSGKGSILYGDSGADVLRAYAGDIAYGGSEDDVLHALGQAAVLHGDNGNDRFILGSFAYGALPGVIASIYGGSGQDTVSVGDASSGKGIVVNMSGQAVQSAVGLVESGQIAIDASRVQAEAEIFSVSNYSQNVFYGGGSSTFNGGSGADTFYLKAGDSANGGAGQDVFYLTPESSSLVKGGANADIFHVRLEEGWTQATLNFTDFQSEDKVYLEWGDKRFLLTETLLKPNIYTGTGEFTVRHTAADEIVVDRGSIVTTYRADGAVSTLTTGQGVVNGWAPMQPHADAMQRYDVSYIAYSALQKAMSDLSPLSEVSQFIKNGPLVADMPHFQDLRLVQPGALTMGFNGLTKSIGFVDLGKLEDGVDLVINDASETRSTAIFGSAGYVGGGFNGATSNETLIAGSGNDVLIAGSGTGQHNLNVGAGSDVLVGGSGNDILIGGTGDDLLLAGGGSNQLNGGAGFDVAFYRTETTGIEVHLSGGQGSVVTSHGTDTLSGIEAIIGTSKNDIFFGDHGALLIGGDGEDIFHLGDLAMANGGAKADKFYIESGATVLLAGLDGSDEIYVGGMRLTGTMYDINFEQRPTDENGSYDLVKKTVISGSHYNGVSERTIGSFDGETHQITLNDVLSDDSSTIQGGNSLAWKGDLAHIQLGDGTDIFIDGFADMQAGLRYELPINEVISSNQNGLYGSSSEVSTMGPSYYPTYSAPLPVFEDISGLFII